MIRYPLTNAQKRIWYAQKKYGDSSVFNIGGRVLINGNVNLTLLAKAFHIFIEQNDALCVKFYEENGEVYQIIHDVIEEVDIIDFLKYKDAEQQCKKMFHEKAKEVFTMTDSLLYYFCVFKLSENQTGYFVKFHHIIADGWSMELLTEQISENYECLLLDHEPNKIRPSYLKYATAESTLSWDKEKSYWLNNTYMLNDMSIPVSSHLEGKRKSFTLDAKLEKKVMVFLKQERITWNIFLIGILQIYQYKKTGQNASSIGIPFWRRISKQERMTVGTYTNTLPFCYKFEEEKTVKEHYTILAKELKEAYKNQCYPVELLAHNLLNNKREGLLYHTCINYYNTVLAHTLGGFSLDSKEFYRGCQEQPLQVIIRHWNGTKIQLDFDYQVALYSDRKIKDMYEQWVLLMEQMMTDPSRKISSMSLISEEDKYKLIKIAVNEMKETAVSWIYCLNHWVLDKPDVIAVSKDDRAWTYAQFYNEIIQQVTYYYKAGVKKGDMVMTAIPHEMKSVAAIYAILLCGAVYVPVSIEWPLDRIKEIQQDCQARFLVGNTISLPDVCSLTLNYESKEKIPYRQFTIPYGEDIAYIIYTSGSTGKPKGVKICHRSLNCYLHWASITYNKKQHEVHALFTNFAFDFTFTALFAPIMNGGEIRIYQSTDEQPNVFDNILNENRVTILKITPCHIGLIQSIEHQNSSIHTCIIGGEDLKTRSCHTLLKKFIGTPRIFNEYGPTEATVGCIVHEYDPQLDKDVSVPIGKPIVGASAFLFDKDGNLLPYDTKAELILGGEGLTCGYHGSSDHTDKFIHNELFPGKTFYRTGDLAYSNERGDYIYCGRIDDELKIRGFRINPSELELKAMESDMVLEAAVQAVVINGSTNLILYIVGSDCYNEKELFRYLSKELPDYMLPRGIMKLDALQLTTNGKVDKSKLPEWKPVQDCSTSLSRTPEAKVLLSIFQELLPERVIVNFESNFYSLGGDSIKAIQISSRILEYGYQLKVTDILTNPIFHEMVKYITKSQNVLEDKILTNEPFEGLPIVKWFFNQNFTAPEQYNQYVVLQFKHIVVKKQLEQILSKIVDHYDSIRINVTPDSNKLFYNPVHLNQPVKITETVIKGHGWENIESEFWKSNYIKFDLEKDLLFKAHLVNANEEQYLVLVFHHLIIDAVSWQIFLHQLSLLMDEGVTDNKQNLPPKTVSYAEFAYKFTKKFGETHISTNSLTTLKETKHTSTVSTTNITPYITTEGIMQQSKTQNQDFFVINKVLNQKLSFYLVGPANSTYNTKPHELIIIALVISMQQIAKINQVEIELESHGRDILPDIDVTRTIGWFTELCPVVITIEDNELEKQIVSIKKQLRQFEKNKYTRSYNSKSLTDKPRPIIRLNYMGNFIEANNNHWKLINQGWENEISTFNSFIRFIDANLFLLQDTLHLVILCSHEWREEGDKFTKHWFKTLELLIEHCMKTDNHVRTPADFEMVDLDQNDMEALLKQL